MSKSEPKKSSSFKFGGGGSTSPAVLSSFAPKKSKGVVDPKKSDLKVIVNYDYTYTHKSKQIQIFKDEVLELIHQTNEHWWKCARGPGAKGFYVPSTYVEILNNGRHESSEVSVGRHYSGDSLSGSESRSASEENLVESSSSTARNKLLAKANSFSSHQGRGSPQLVDIDISQQQSDEEEASSPVSAKRIASSIPNAKPLFPAEVQRGLRNSSSFRRAKTNEKLVAASSLTRIDTDISSKEDRIYSSVKETKKKPKAPVVPTVAAPLSKAIPWTKSLEELTKQIQDKSKESTKKIQDEKTPSSICFKNPAFQSSGSSHQGSEVSNIKVSSGAEPPKLTTFSPVPARAKKEPLTTAKKPIPRPRNDGSLTKTVIQIGRGSTDSLNSIEDHVSSAAFTSGTSETVSVPVGSSSSHPLPRSDTLSTSFDETEGTFTMDDLPPPLDESLLDKQGEALFLDVQNRSTTSQNSLASSNDDDIPEPCEEWFKRTLANNWNEYKCPYSDRTFYCNSVSHNKSWKPPRMSRSESNNNHVFSPPAGWTQKVDDSGAISFISQTTGSEWLTSTDPAGRLYFYEKDSSKSSWVLPGSDITSGPSTSATTSASQRIDSRSSSGDLSEPDELPPVVKRLSAGDNNRVNKTQSLCMPGSKERADSAKLGSLPRQLSIWANGMLDKEKEGPLSWTKVFDKHKKVRKNWTNGHAVLTTTHISFFKDKSALNSVSIKSELEIDLHHVNSIDWDRENKLSSKKNVFQICSNDMRILCQTSDGQDGGAWINRLNSVCAELQGPDERQLKLLSTSPPPIVGMESLELSKRRGTSKSAKLTITEDSEKKNPSRSLFMVNLNSFFHRRQSRDALEKKGIIKDESVFGSTLEKLTRTEKTLIPRFVDKCIEVIERKEENLKTDGLYRASGNLSQIQRIRLKVDQDNLAVLEEEEDVHVLAGSLKLFFREMKEPAIPVNLFGQFVKATHTRKEEKLGEFKKLIKKLPPANYHTLKRVFGHLLVVSKYSSFNRMEIQNIAIVFGPNLMWNALESTNMVSQIMEQNYAVEYLLKEYDNLFS